MTDVFAKEFSKLKLSDFNEDFPKAKPPSSLDLLREAGVAGGTRPRNSIDIVGDIVKIEKEKRLAESARLREVRAAERYARTAAGKPGALSIPSWTDATAQIEGFDALPYAEKKSQYDKYVQLAVSQLASTNPGMDAALIEQQVRDTSPAPADPAAGKSNIGRGISAGIANTKAAATGALGYVLSKMGSDETAEDLFKSMQTYTTQAQDLGKANDAFTEALKPGGSLVDYALYNVGQMLPSLVESAITAAAGAAAGGAAGGAPAIPGAVVGFFSKSAMKREFQKTGSEFLMARFRENAKTMARKEALELATNQTQDALQRAARKTIGGVGAMMAASYTRGIGEIAQNAQGDGIDPKTLNALKVASGASAYALLETFSDKLLLDSFKGAGGGAIKRTLKKGALAGTTEGLTEVGQDAATGLAAGTGLPDPVQAVNAFAGGFTGGGIVGGGAALIGGDTTAPTAATRTAADTAAEEDLTDVAPDDSGTPPPGTAFEVDGATLVWQEDGTVAYADGQTPNATADALVTSVAPPAPPAAAVVEPGAAIPPTPDDGASFAEEIITRAGTESAQELQRFISSRTNDPGISALLSEAVADYSDGNIRRTEFNNRVHALANPSPSQSAPVTLQQGPVAVGQRVESVQRQPPTPEVREAIDRDLAGNSGVDDLVGIYDWFFQPGTIVTGTQSGRRFLVAHEGNYSRNEAPFIQELAADGRVLEAPRQMRLVINPQQLRDALNETQGSDLLQQLSAQDPQTPAAETAALVRGAVADPLVLDVLSQEEENYRQGLVSLPQFNDRVRELVETFDNAERARAPAPAPAPAPAQASTPVQGLPVGTTATSATRDTALLPPETSMEFMRNGSPDSMAQQPTTYRWMLQNGVIVTTNAGGQFLVLNYHGSGQSATVQALDSHNVVIGAPYERNFEFRFADVVPTLPAGITRAPPRSRSSGWVAPTATAAQQVRPTATAAKRGITVLRKLGRRVFTGDDTNFRGVEAQGALARVTSTAAGTSAKMRHFVEAMREGISQLNANAQGSAVTWRMAESGDAVGIYITEGSNQERYMARANLQASGTLYIDSTGFSNTTTRGTEDAFGGRFYDVLYGASVVSGLKPYLGGITADNAKRMPVNRLRAMLKWGSVHGFSRARSVLSVGRSGASSFTGYEAIEDHPDAALLKLLQLRVLQSFGSNPVFNLDGTYTIGDRTFTRPELRTFVRERAAESQDVVAAVALANAMASPRASATALSQAFIDTQLDSGPMLFDIAEGQQSETPTESTPQIPRNNTQSRLRGLRARFQRGRLSAEEVVQGVNEIIDDYTNIRDLRRWSEATTDRVRGADLIRERLINARRTGKLDADTVALTLWAVDQNPAIAEGLGLSLRDPKANSPAGQYNPFTRVMTLFSGRAHRTTGAHEILHHTERMMPVNVQLGIVAEYQKTLEAALKAATPEQAAAILDLIEGAAGNKPAMERAMQALKDGVLDYDQHYPLANASEFWAVNATDIMAGRFDAQGSWIAQAKQWLSEFLQKVKSILGMRSNAAVIKALNAVLKGDGKKLSNVQLAQYLQTGPVGVQFDIAPEVAATPEPAVDNDVRPQRRGTVAALSSDIANGVPASPSTPTRGLLQAVQSRDTDGLRKVRNQFLERLNEELHDASVRMKRWLQTLPEGEGGVTPLMKQAVIGSMYRARKIRDELLRRANVSYLRKIDKGIAAFAKKHNITLETAQRDMGYMLTATYVPEANAKLLATRIAELKELQKKVDDARNAQQTEEIGEDFVPEAQEAADNAPIDTVPLEALEAQLANAQIQLVELIKAINSPNLTVRKHGGGGVAGMNNAQAAKMLADLRTRYGAEGFAEIQKTAETVYDLNAWKLALDIETGKVTPAVAVRFLRKPAALQALKELRDLATASNAESKASVDALNAKREEVMALVRSKYVPLTGDPTKALEDDGFHSGSGAPNVQRDYRMEGRERGSPPDEGLSTSRAALLKSASFAGWRDFQDGIANIHRVLTPEQRNDFGIHAQVLDGNRSTLSNKAIVRARDGKATAYIFTDENMVDAIRGASRLENNFLLEGMGKVTKFYSYMATQFNPFFAPFNFLRDAWERNEILRTRTYLKEDGSTAASGAVANGMLRYLTNPELLRATYRFAFGKPVDTNSRMGRYLEEFLRQGGVSGFSSQFAADRSKMIAQINKQKNWRKQVGILGDFIASYNKTLDIAPALAAYVSLRDAGVSVKDSAAGSLDLMDFGKRGKSANVLGSVYAFAQPTFTGAANAIGALYDPVAGKWNKTGVTRFAGYAIGLFVLQSFLRSLADDDEGGNKLDQQSPFIKNNFLLIPYGDDGMIKVPLAYGLVRVANGIARAALGVSTDEQSPTEALGKFASGSVVPVFSPIEDSDIDWFERPMQAFLTLLSPSWMKPPLALATNTTPFDTKIVNEKYGDPKKFKSEQYGKYIPEDYKAIAIFMRKTLGIDMAPEEVRYLVRAYPTGAAQLVLNGTIEEPEGGISEAALKKVYMGYSEYARYFQFKKAIDQTDELMKRKDAGEPVEGVDAQLLRWRVNWDEQDKALRAAKGKVTRSKVLSEAGKVAEAGRVNDSREAAQLRALYNFRKLQGKPATVGEP